MTGEPADDVAVKVDGVSKTFRLPQEQVHTLKERVLHPPRRPSFEALHALRDVSFEIRSGEVFGIVGRNGSGKSTLMKCLAGIYQADAGEMWLRGRMAPFIELGVGFNTDLTAYDNVLVNAVMLGLNPDEARRRYDSILDFAELHEFAELKLKNYSSGMLVRLAFSVMVHVDADLLLIDEVLAVGDAAFQQKCYDSVNRLRREGKTIVLVTHDMGAVERFCDRALLLERGRVAAIGEATSVSRRYTAVNFAVTERTTAEFRQAAGGAGEAREGAALEIASVWTQDAMGVRGQSTQGRPCALIMNMTFRRALRDPIFAFAVHDEQGRRVLVVTSEHAGPTGDFDAGEQIATGASFDMWLAPGRYSVTALVSDPGRAQSVVAVAEDAASVVVSGADARGGMVDVRHDFFVERAMRPQAHSAGTAGG